MKRIAILALAAAMFISPLMSTASAMEPFAKQDQLTEGRHDRRGGNRGGRHNDRGRDRRRHRSSSGGAIAGAIIGGLIVGGIVASNSKPKQPVLYCDAYGNCWYQYQ